MAILRNTTRDKFTIVSGAAIRDENLSLKALGLLVKLLSLPDNWVFSEKGIESVCKKDGLTSIKTALKELEKAGYLTREQARKESGIFTNAIWTVREAPMLENPICENQISENRTQYNTNIIKTNILNTIKDTPHLREEVSLKTRPDGRGGFPLLNSYVNFYNRVKPDGEDKEHPNVIKNEASRIEGILETMFYSEDHLLSIAEKFFSSRVSGDHNVWLLISPGWVEILGQRIYGMGAF